jgi:hypothetical protein
MGRYPGNPWVGPHARLIMSIALACPGEDRALTAKMLGAPPPESRCAYPKDWGVPCHDRRTARACGSRQMPHPGGHEICFEPPRDFHAVLSRGDLSGRDKSPTRYVSTPTHSRPCPATRRDWPQRGMPPLVSYCHGDPLWNCTASHSTGCPGRHPQEPRRHLGPVFSVTLWGEDCSQSNLVSEGSFRKLPSVPMRCRTLQQKGRVLEGRRRAVPLI